MFSVFVLELFVKHGMPSTEPCLFQATFPILLGVVATSSLRCCNFTNRPEGLTGRAVAVAVACTAADPKAAHVTAWVRRVRCRVRAGAIRVVAHALHGCATGWSRRMRALHRGVRRLLRGRALRSSLHSIALARRTYGILLRRKRLRPLSGAVHLMGLAVAGRAGITASAV